MVLPEHDEALMQSFTPPDEQIGRWGGKNGDLARCTCLDYVQSRRVKMGAKCIKSHKEDKSVASLVQLNRHNIYNQVLIY